jgi:serine/threonine protein kinase
MNLRISALNLELSCQIWDHVNVFIFITILFYYFLCTNKGVVPVAYFISDPPKTLVTPIGLRAPELILSGKVNKSLDIWSFGCLVFEYITGERLFDVSAISGSQEEQTDDHLLMLSDTLGPLPENLYNLWTRSSKYYTPERVLFNSIVYPANGIDPLSFKMGSLEETFDEVKPVDLSDEEAMMVKALIRRILQYDPTKRPTPSQILQDPWFAK